MTFFALRDYEDRSGVRIKPSSRLSSSGRISVTLTCPATIFIPRCASGYIELRAFGKEIGNANHDIARGSRRTLRIRISNSAAKKIRKARNGALISFEANTNDLRDTRTHGPDQGLITEPTEKQRRALPASRRLPLAPRAPSFCPPVAAEPHDADSTGWIVVRSVCRSMRSVERVAKDADFDGTPGPDDVVFRQGSIVVAVDRAGPDAAAERSAIEG